MYCSHLKRWSVSISWISVCEQIAELASEQGIAAYVVGGAVRDALYSDRLPLVDLDISVEGPADELGRRIAELFGGSAKPFPQFLTCRVVLPGEESTEWHIDFATARSEVYLKPGALPEVSQASFEEDLKRRDFSVNSIGISVESFLLWLKDSSYPISEQLIDPFGGALDLEAGLIRVLHEKSFQDDPTRIFRGYRYKARIDGTFEAKTLGYQREALAAGALKTIEPYRLRSELALVADEPKAAVILGELWKDGVFNLLGGPEPEEADSEIWDSFRDWAAGRGALGSDKLPLVLAAVCSSACYGMDPTALLPWKGLRGNERKAFKRLCSVLSDESAESIDWDKLL